MKSDPSNPYEITDAMIAEPIQRDKQLVALLAEMNRHIEQLITLKAEGEAIRCAVNDRHALINEPFILAQRRLGPSRRWWQI